MAKLPVMLVVDGRGKHLEQEREDRIPARDNAALTRHSACLSCIYMIVVRRTNISLIQQQKITRNFKFNVKKKTNICQDCRELLYDACSLASVLIHT